jgi:hypothetical protein
MAEFGWEDEYKINKETQARTQRWQEHSASIKGGI